MRLPYSMILTVAAFTQVGATDCGTIIRDPGFELWCGEELCSWKVLRGEVREVPTWHKADSGVELIGRDAAISQLTPVASSDGVCIRFDLVANVEENVEARLEIDVYGDGSIDLSERMPTSKWKPLSYKIRIKPPYSGVRFQLSKKGDGRAVFAQIAAEIDNDCQGLPEIIPELAPLGAQCSDDAMCASGMCEIVSAPGAWLGYVNVCVACTAGSCGAGEVCGRGEALSGVLAVPHVCVATNSHELGEQCVVDEECASMLCNEGVCSTCGGATTCPDELCDNAYLNGPSVCAPGERHRTANEPCATDGDCLSNQCNGAVRKQCLDGRVCDSPMDCPVGSGLTPGECREVGIQGGRCQ